jgi:hypothetical protein
MFGERATQLDLRLSKALRKGRVRGRVILDVANVLNGSPVLVQQNAYGQNWLRPSFVMPGRLFKPTVQFDF